jgi:cell division transport system permease protein
MLWLRLHGQAFVDAVRRLAGQPVASALSILVLATALALPVIAAVVLRSVGAVTAALDTEPHVNVFLALDATDDDVKRVELALKSHGEIVSLRFVPRSQALAELKASTHLGELLASLDRNPLPDAFTARVRTTDPERIAAAKAAWLRLPKVDQVLADFEWSERLARWIQFGDRVLVALGVLLGAAVAFIVGHLIRLQVVTRREEIEVSQLIGATAADVRRPFLYHGALQGLLAGGAAVGIAAAFSLWGEHQVRALAPDYATELKVIFLALSECLAVAAIAGALGLFGAWRAVGRELRRFSAIGKNGNS